MRNGTYHHEGMVHPEPVELYFPKNYVYQEPGYMNLSETRRALTQMMVIRLMAKGDPERQKWAQERIRQIRKETFSIKGLVRRMIKH